MEQNSEQLATGDPTGDTPLDPALEIQIDAALGRARLVEDRPEILEATYHPGPVHAYLMLRLSDGRRLLIPRETLPELKDATDEQAADIMILQPANAIHWPQLDEGLYLPEFLAHRWHTERSVSEYPLPKRAA